MSRKTEEELPLFSEIGKHKLLLTKEVDFDDTIRSISNRYNMCSLETDKSEFDWLLTPPCSPLFPSLEMESQKTVGTPKASLNAQAPFRNNTQSSATAIRKNKFSLGKWCKSTIQSISSTRTPGSAIRTEPHGARLTRKKPAYSSDAPPNLKTSLPVECVPSASIRDIRPTRSGPTRRRRTNNLKYSPCETISNATSEMSIMYLDDEISSSKRHGR